MRLLASKELIERLDLSDAEATGIDPDGIVYTQLGELGSPQSTACPLAVSLTSMLPLVAFE